MGTEEKFLEVLKGNLSSIKWPVYKTVKIYIASTRKDFVEERKNILEFIGPELQSHYDDAGIEVEMFDMHFGTIDDVCYDPKSFEDHLHEIKQCHRISRGCFFIGLVGNKYDPYCLPTTLTEEQYKAIHAKAAQLSLGNDLLETWYEHVDNTYVLNQSSQKSTDKWKDIVEELGYVVQTSAKYLSRTDPTKFRFIAMSALEKQFTHALGLSLKAAHNVIAVIRDWEKVDKCHPDYQDSDKCGRLDVLQHDSLRVFRDRLAACIPNENRAYFSVKWKSGGGLDPDLDEHEIYLHKFRDTLKLKLQTLIDRALEEDPEPKSKDKTVQEVLQEAACHLALCQRSNIAIAEIVDWKGSTHFNRVKTLLTSAQGSETGARHSPILIYGAHGSGKTSLLLDIFETCESWFGHNIFRIVRFAGQTPCSSYNLELLRILCQQLSILLNCKKRYLPKDASFDPLYINNWFQNLMRKCEEPKYVNFIILIDDLHRLNSLDSDIMAPLSWLPLCLPRNVHIVATTSLPLESLKFTPVQRERFRNSENYLILPSFRSDTDLEKDIHKSFDDLEVKYPRLGLSRLANFITCSKFGLSEMELLELLMPTSNVSAPLTLSAGNYNFSTFCSVRRSFGTMISEKTFHGKNYISWAHELTAEIATKRYLTTPDIIRSVHLEIANLFFSEALQTASEAEGSEETATTASEEKKTPFHTQQVDDETTYNHRHVEESWVHLLKTGDDNRLKQLAACNFDFLITAVQTVSVSYLRCVLEDIRGHILDRDVELVYYTIRKSSDVLTRDPLQLAAQIICWLRSTSEGSGPLLSRMIIQAMAWCDGFTAPLLVPLNGWLQPPLPLQIKTLQVPSEVRLVQPTPSGQHVILVPKIGDPQLWHVMSNTMTHVFKGHSGPVLCLTVVKQTQYLLTGSDDISIIVWDLKTLTLKLRIYEHIAPVLTLVPALNNTAIVSGGEDSRIIITSLFTGDVVVKIDHHRGPVTSVRLDTTGDVLISGSADGTFCLWSLENFSLLNSVTVPSPVDLLEISTDSIFLLAGCEDNLVYLHSLTTGTYIHPLRGHKGKILSLCIAEDNCRAIVGCSDGKIYIYDMYSGQLSRTLISNASEVTTVKVTEKDDFLVTGGGNRITYWSFRHEDPAGIAPNSSFITAKKEAVHKITPQAPFPHAGPITCVDISRDGTMAVTGGTDAAINMWQLNTHNILATLDGHTANVTCVGFAPSGLFVVSGSEDMTVRVWGITFGFAVSTFKEHQATVTSIGVLMDSRRVLSGDRQGNMILWFADTAASISQITAPSMCLSTTHNMAWAVCGNGDNCLRIWAIKHEEEKYNIYHSEEITCFVLTHDSQYIITGSKDMSLKVWQVSGGKLAQVLVGHTDQVTCAAISVLKKSLVVSGSRDSNLIVWDIDTGNDIFVLQGHLGYVTCVKVSGDGGIAVSAGSEDKCIIVWDIKCGKGIASLQMQLPILNLEMSTDASRIAVHLHECSSLPIICLHNTPATYVKMPIYVAPAKEVEDLRPNNPKRPMRRLLKKEVSLDTYTWQKKYGHLTSPIMMATVDERLKRRLSVSASMEEISKIPGKGNMGSQGIGPEQAALAQSQHFDQLEALWNKRSPPRRRHNQFLSKKNHSGRRNSPDLEEQDSEDAEDRLSLG